MTPIRKSALNYLATFYHLLDQREQILSILHKALENPASEIQETAFNCLKKYNKNTKSYASQLRQTQVAVPENFRQIIQIAAEYLRDYFLWVLMINT